MAFKPVAGAQPTASSAPAPTGFKPVATSPTSPDAPDDSGSPSLFGFLGNVAQEAKDMAQGITSLVGAGVSDLGNLGLEAVTLGQAETDYKLDDIAMALPKALAQDYNDRYGLSKFAEGDIWGGLGAVLTGLYEHPLSAIGDALMVGSAVKWTAKAGLVGEAAKAKILGPGIEQAATLTGKAAIPQVLSQNPVARLAQRKLYEVMSYGGRGDATAARLGFGGPQEFIQGKVAAGATDQAIRATQNLFEAAGEPGSTPMRVLRPSVSAFLEKRGVNTILSHMGMASADASAQGSLALRRVLEAEGMTDEIRDDVTSLAMGTRGVLPDVNPSDATSVHWAPKTQPAELPDVRTVTGPDGMPLTTTLGTSPRMLDAAQAFRRRFDRPDPRRGRELNAPHDFSTSERNAVTLETDDMDAAYDVADRYAQEVGGQVIAYRNYTADVDSSYDGIHYWVQDGDGAIHDVSVATPDLKEAQEAWSHMALQANDKTAELEGLQAQLDEMARNPESMNPNAEVAIGEQMARVEDELRAIEVLNDQTFAFTRRFENARESGMGYDPALAAVDRIRNINYNNATRIEVRSGGLTYRKILDRSFGPIRAEKWSRMMTTIEQRIATRLEQAQIDGIPKDQWDDIVLAETEAVLGRGNPFMESMYRTKIRERIPFDTGERLGDSVSDIAPGYGRGVLATGERTIDPRPYAARGWYGAEDAYQDVLRGGGSEAQAIAAYDDVFYHGASEEIAHRLTMRLREATHKPMVENGEFTGLSWPELAREQVTGGLPFPQYFPHIKASKATADVAIVNQHRSQMKTVLEGQDARMKKWGGWLYEKGTFERDPIKAYEAAWRQVQRHDEFRNAMHQLIDKYGRKVNRDELNNWDLDVRGEVLVSRAGLDGMVDSRSKLIMLTHEGVMSGESLETATVKALDAVLQDAISAAADPALDDIWALPKYVADQMKTAAKLQMPGTFNFYYDSAMGAWKSAALSLSPRWVVNNTLGNAIYMGMSRPGAIRHFVSQLMPGARARFRAAMGDDMLNAIERDFMHGEDLLSSTQKLARRAERGNVGWGQRVADSPLQQARPVAAVRGFSSKMRQLNKYIEGAARRGVAIDDIRRANMTGFGERFLGSHRILEDAAKGGITSAADYDRIIRSVNSVLGDYLTMSPVEAQIIRRFVMPFYAFYRHTAGFLARMPFEHPLKVAVLQQIAEVDRQINPYMPDYMLGTANIAGLNVQFGGANPLEAVTQTYAPQITHPLLGLTVQRMTGTNPFGRDWTNEPPGGSIELFGGQRYVIHRDSEGRVTGVQPADDWAPPLYESILGIVPQAGMIFDPFDRAVYKRIAGPLTGLSFPSYDPEQAQFYAVRDQIAALKAAMRIPAP